jgi:hypothetical protein
MDQLLNLTVLMFSWNFFLMQLVLADAAPLCEVLKASLRYTQEDAPTDLSGVVG